MGLGKTVSTLTALSNLLRVGEVEKVLVIAPLNVAKTVWHEEAKKWDHLRHLRVAKLLGDAVSRTHALGCNADIYIINRENVQWLVHYCK